MKTLVLKKAQLPAVKIVRDFEKQQAKLDALIDYAAKVENAALLGDASSQKIAEIADFCAWWMDEITPNQLVGLKNVVVPEQEPRKKPKIDVPLWKKRVHRWRKKLPNEERWQADLVLAALRKAGIKANENFLAKGTGKNEWYTPVEYIHAAKAVMGDIDVNPASSEEAQALIKAHHYFTKQDDGLAQEWNGRVWLNPPYSSDLIGLFIRKLLHEYKSKRTSQAVLLVHSYTDTGWFQEAATLSAAICFARQRVKFYDQDGNKCDPTQGQSFVYFGDEAEKFREVFIPLGLIVRVYAEVE